jgi:hypothetical protein
MKKLIQKRNKEKKIRERISFWFLAFLALGLVFIAPIWLQNRYVELSEKEASLSKEVLELKAKIKKMELKNNRMSSLNHLSKVAEKKGFDYNTVPLKLMMVGGN